MYIEWAVRGDQKWHWKETLEEEGRVTYENVVR
jgi:hypothetical protein